MAYEDKQLTCKDCGAAFTWTASEQEFYAQKGFSNSPVRCPNCRRARKANQYGGSGGGGDGYGQRQMSDAVCAKCGAQCQVPFKPRGDKPVYCSDCFRSMRTSA